MTVSTLRTSSRAPLGDVPAARWQFINHDVSARRRQRLQHTHVAKVNRRNKQHVEQCNNVKQPSDTEQLCGNQTQPGELKTRKTEAWEHATTLMCGGDQLKQHFQCPNSRSKSRKEVCIGRAGTTCATRDQRNASTEEEIRGEPIDIGFNTRPSFSYITKNAHIPTARLASPELFRHLLTTQFEIVWPSYSPKFDRELRFRLICQEPLALHTYALTTSVHHDALLGRPDWCRKPEVAMHLSQVVSLLNQLLADIKRDQIELALMTMVLLPITNLDWHQETLHNASLFRPLLPPRSLVNVWGKVLHGAAYLQDTQSALFELVTMHGGLGCIRARGLSEVILIADLFMATRLSSRCRFPWPSNVADIMSDGIGHSTFDHRLDLCWLVDAEYCLPESFIETLSNVRLANEHLDDRRNLTSQTIDTHKSDALRYAAQHDVLQIPAWEDLQMAQQARMQQYPYELIRLVTQLYSSAIILGMPPSSGWHTLLLEKLRDLVESEGPSEPSDAICRLNFWAFLVAGMAAYFTRYKAYFRRRLAQSISQNTITDWDQAQNVASKFLWSYQACEQGSVVFLAALEASHHGEDDAN